MSIGEAPLLTHRGRVFDETCRWTKERLSASRRRAKRR